MTTQRLIPIQYPKSGSLGIILLSRHTVVTVTKQHFGLRYQGNFVEKCKISGMAIICVIIFSKFQPGRLRAKVRESLFVLVTCTRELDSWPETAA
jgi:hypothetical protein